MEIYKDLSSPASRQFEELLNTQLSKNKIEEGKIIEGKITKITDKFVFIFIPGLKSEPIVDINELRTIGLKDKIVVGENIPVLLEKIEDKNGEVVVSAIKAQKIKGWYKLEKAYDESDKFKEFADKNKKIYKISIKKVIEIPQKLKKILNFWYFLLVKYYGYE